jgi:hypothetical protein
MLKIFAYLQEKAAISVNKQSIDAAKAAIKKLFTEVQNSLILQFNVFQEYLSSYSESSFTEDVALRYFGLNQKSVKYLITNYDIYKGTLESKILSDIKFKQLMQNANSVLEAMNKLANELKEIIHYPLQTNNIPHILSGKSIIMPGIQGNCKVIIDMDKEFNKKVESISIGNLIYAVGGKSSTSSESLNTMLEVNINTKKIAEKCPLLIKKYNHSMCELSEFIYSVGGINGLYITDVEKYDIMKDNWVSLPNMITPRGSAGVFTFNRIYLFALAGYNDNGNVNTLERLFIPSPNCWEMIAMSFPFPLRNSLHTIQISDSGVIAFGSYSRSKETFILNISDTSVGLVKSGNLAKGGKFHKSCTPTIINSRVYSVDANKGLHVYSIVDGKWDYTKI